MNYHYIDYMIKERQRDEIEACERRRLLNSAGYGQKSLIHWVNNIFSKAAQRLKELRLIPPKKLHSSVTMVHDVVQTKGGRR